MDCGDFVVCLVVADHLDFQLAGFHQGDNLPRSPHKRLAEAVEFELACWVNHLDHGTSLSVQEHPIAEELPSAIPTQDGYGLGVDLRDDGDSPRCEVWDVDQLPCLCSEPEHLHRAQILVIVTQPACDVALQS